MAFDLSSVTREKRIRAPRIILLGGEKIGKSTFAASADSPVFVSIAGEEGVDDLDVAKWPEPVRTFQDILTAIGSLYHGDHDYKTVVIDSGSTLEPIIWESVCCRNPNKDGTTPETIEKVGGGWQKGYTEALCEWGMLMKGLDALRDKKNMTSIIIGHVRIRKFSDPAGLSYDQYQFDINEKAASKLYRWADAILFTNTKTSVKEEDAGFNRKRGKGADYTGGQRYLYTQKRPAHPGGGRGVFGRLPYEIPISLPSPWSDYQQAIISQIQAEQETQ